jgi:hypothetical protein
MNLHVRRLESVHASPVLILRVPRLPGLLCILCLGGMNIFGPLGLNLVCGGKSYLISSLLFEIPKTRSVPDQGWIVT